MSMRADYSYWSGARVSTIVGILVTLLAWMTSGSLFIVLRLIPLTRGEPLTIYSTSLGSFLPWFAGCVFWVRVRRRKQLGKADKEASGFCYSLLFSSVMAAYISLLLVETVLLSSFTTVH